VSRRLECGDTACEHGEVVYHPLEHVVSQRAPNQGGNALAVVGVVAVRVQDRAPSTGCG
jgi:hypothetical protein